MKALPKNWSSLNKMFCLSLLNQKALTCLLVFLLCNAKAQVVNYVNNGGFEVPKSNNMQKPKYWDAIDTTKYMGILLSQTITPFLVPNSSFTHQWPVEGANHLASTMFYKPNTPSSQRGYPRNLLKQILQAGKTYCVKFYCNVTDQSSYGIDGIGAYFGTNTLDTITQCDRPIAYLTPQIQYTGLITDTMNWIPITGTFVATGNEKYMMLGNFKSDVATNTVLINPTNLPLVFNELLYDNVSVIDIDLPPFAGRDTFFIPGDSIYLGRPSDVGIDEYCMWYKLPNTTTAVDTIAGFWLKPTTTCTYVVKQDICGVVKWDTIILYQSAIGINELNKNNRVKLYPNPAHKSIHLELNENIFNDKLEILILNNLGQNVKQERIIFVTRKAELSIEDLPDGIYQLKLMDNKNTVIVKKFVVSHE